MIPIAASGLRFRCLPVLFICALLHLSIPATILAQSPSVEGATRDFAEYWSAARIFLDGGNPYSAEELLALQQTAGWGGVQPLPMWNPPWALLMVLPFGLLPFAAGQFLWLTLQVCLLLISAQLLWRIYAGSSSPSWLPWALALTFVPAVFVLIIGQITPLVLAALTCFLHAERRQSYWAMSAALIVLSIKPHLLYLFWIVFLLWIFDKHPRRLIVSAAACCLMALLLPLLFDVEIYSKYLGLYETMGVSKPLDWPTPTLRNMIRILLGVEHGLPQFAPTVLAAAWAVYYWLRHRHGWRWREHVPLLVTVSVASSVFVWTYDQVILLPAIMEAAAGVLHGRMPWYRYWAVRLYLAINAGHGLLRFWFAEELHYFWLAPSLLVAYLIFCWERNRQNSCPTPAA